MSKAKTKILFLCPFDLDQNTGTPIRLKTEIGALSKIGDYQIMVCSSKSSLKKNIFPGKRALLFWFEAIIFLFRFKPEIIHAVSPLVAPVLLVAKFLCFRKIKIILEVHGLARYEYKGLFLFKKLLIFLEFLNFWFSDFYIAMSYSQKNILVENYGLNTDSIFVLWGPVDLRNFSFTEYPKLSRRVCYTGNDSFWQGLDEVLEASKFLKDEGIEFYLYGPKENRRLSPDNVVFCGKFEFQDLFSAVKDCAVFISPRLKDVTADLQYPQKLSFYLGAGRPVIVTNVSDQGNIVRENDLGFVYSSGDVLGLVSSVREFFNLSGQEKESMGRRSLQFAYNNLDLDIFVTKLQKVYNQLR